MTKTNVKIGDIIYDIYGNKFELTKIETNRFTIKDVNTDNIFIISDFINESTGIAFYYLKPPTIKGIPVYFKEQPDFKIDDILLVYRYSTKEYVVRYFSHFDTNNSVYVFRFGATSISTEQTYEIGKYVIPNKDINIAKQIKELNAEIVANLDS
jgi:hypothetical protein